MAGARDCIAEIEAAAGGRIDDIEPIVDELEWARREYGNGAEFFDFVDERVRQAETAAAVEKRNKQLNIIARERIKERMRLADELYGDPSLGLEAAMVGVNRVMEGGRDSVDKRAKGMLSAYMGRLLVGLKRAGHVAAFKSGEMDRDIARELWDASLRNPTGKATTSRTAKEIAAIIREIQNDARQMENRAGAWIGKRQGYIVTQSHDRLRMRRQGFEAWAEEIGPKLDWNAMRVPQDRRAAALRDAYDSLVSGGRPEIRGGDESDLDLKYIGPGNLAKRESASRVLLFRSADDWFDYNEKFGTGNLNESLFADLSRASQNTALMQVFGTNPQAMRDTLLAEIGEEFKSDPGKVARLKRRALESQFKEIDGSINIARPDGLSLAAFSRGVRTIQSMAKLGGAFLSSVTDMATAAAERNYQGRSLLESVGDGLMAPVRGLTTTGQQREYADLIGVGIESMMGDFVSRFAAQDNVPGRLSKAQALFFKFNLLGPWTDAVKRGAGMMLARDLAVNANKALADLDPPMRRLLEQYGFDARKWEIARASITDLGDGRTVMLPGEVQNVRGAMFTGLNERQQKVLRDEVAQLLHGLIVDRSDFASITSGARERAILRQGLEPGTAAGEAVRFFMQFKGFPITLISKVLGRDIYGYGTKRGALGALATGEADLKGLAAFIAFSTVMGYVALQSKEMAKGRSPREMSLELVYASMMQGGALGLYGDFLFGDYTRYGNSFWGSAMGPTASVVEDVTRIFSKATRGEDVAADMVRLTQSNIPFVNIFYAKAALDYLVWYELQEWASPGYLQRMERRVARDNGQTFMLPPSQAIPHGAGGGFPITFEGVR